MKAWSGRLGSRSRSDWRRASVAAAAALACLAAGGEPIRVEALDGTVVGLELAEGEKALLVHFWATWCPSCLEEIALLDAAASDCARDGVRVTLVNVAESRATVVAFAREHGLRLPHFLDPKGRAWRRVSGAGLPLNIEWTREDRSIELGPRDSRAWRERLRALGCTGGPA